MNKKNPIYFVPILFFAFNCQAQQAELAYKDSPCAISNVVLQKALADYNHLNETDYFDTKRIKTDSELWKKVFAQEKAQTVTIKREGGGEINAVFFDRGSDKAVIVGQGFHARKEYLIPFLKICSGYDLLFFDYQGHREMLGTYACYGRSTLDAYFIEPQKDVCALGNFLRDRKSYRAIIGLGMCYSGLIFSGAQALSQDAGKPLFDKLILDSSISSLKEIALQVCRDPLLFWYPKEGGTPQTLQWFLGSWPVKAFASGLGWIFLGQQFSHITTENYLSHIDLPVLFIRGEHDSLVSPEISRRLYESVRADSACMVTLPSQHTLNHIKFKELYAHFVNEFIKANSVADFAQKLVLPDQQAAVKS